jgi:hypothetical protein
MSTRTERTVATVVARRGEVGSTPSARRSYDATRGPEVEERAEAAGYRLARRSLRGQLAWWWQLIVDTDDTRQPCWLERRQALSYMEAVLDRLAVVR